MKRTVAGFIVIILCVSVLASAASAHFATAPSNLIPATATAPLGAYKTCLTDSFDRVTAARGMRCQFASNIWTNWYTSVIDQKCRWQEVKSCSAAVTSFDGTPDEVTCYTHEPIYCVAVGHTRLWIRFWYYEYGRPSGFNIIYAKPAPPGSRS